jgi:pimeloyl-ACP methyl ester carboxylesterase
VIIGAIMAALSPDGATCVNDGMPTLHRGRRGLARASGRSFALRLAALLALAGTGAAALADEAPPSNGEPPSVGFVITRQVLVLSGQEQQVDVYQPLDRAARGVAIVAHGFGRSRLRHRGLGKALAESGVIAVIPDLPNLINLWGNGAALVELAHALEAGALGLPPVERAELVLIGTSAGGLASVLAAAELPGLAGWIGLDPVDRTGTGVAAAGRLASPAVVLLAPPTGCNLFGSGRAIAGALPRLLRSTTLAGASHCDFEDPTNKLCQVICGESSPQLQARIRSEVVAAATTLLSGRIHHAAGATDSAP